jgi:hypothetical protein
VGEDCKSYSILSFWFRQLHIDEALQYFPDVYDEYLFVFNVPEGYEDKAKEWYYDYRELHEHILISKYGTADRVKIMRQERDYQEYRKHSYFHDSSWYMRGTNGYDGKGCNEFTCLRSRLSFLS